MDDWTVMTWNVRYFGHGLRGLRATPSGMRRAAEALASVVPLPDLVALQEVETRSLRGGLHPQGQLLRFLDQLHRALARAGRPERFRGVYFPAHRYGLGRGPAVYTTGLAVLVGPRLEIVADNAASPDEITHHRVPWTRRVKQTRVVGHVRVRPREGGRPLDLFNTHLSLPAFLEVGPHRVHARMGHGSNQLAEVQAVLDALSRRSDGAAVLVGDFNTAPGSAAYDALTGAGLVDAFAHANDLAPQDLHGIGTAGFAAARMHIDHIFSDPDVAWKQVHAHQIDDEGPFRGVSDHTPKVGSFHWPTLATPLVDAPAVSP